MNVRLDEAMRFQEIQPEDVKEVIILRTMVKENVLTMADLIRLGITEDEVIRKIRTDYKGWLCRVNERIVGFCIGNRRDGEMWVIAVLPEFERRGIGRQLMILLQDWLFENNDALWLTTEDNANNRAYGFYESLGWKKIESDKGHCQFILRKRAQ